MCYLGCTSHQWNNNFYLLVKYNEENRNCKVTQKYVLDGVTLGLWLKRKWMLMKKGELDIDRQVQLEKMGVIWNKSHQWEIYINLLVKYNEETRNCKVLQSYVVGGVNLGLWLNRQRCSIEKGNLNNGRTYRLLALVNISRKQTESKYTHLQRSVLCYFEIYTTTSGTLNNKSRA